MRLLMSILLAAAALGCAPASASGASWGWPLEGVVITPFAQGSDPYASGDHRGIDIQAADGTSVVAPVGGRVRWTGTLGSGGRMVSLTTSAGTHILSFLHLSRIAVKRGQTVSQGEQIGLSGSSGDMRGRPPHLHFGVRVPAGDRFRYVDPLPLLAASGKAAMPTAKPKPVRRQRAHRRARRKVGRQAPASIESPPVAANPVEQRPLRPAAAEPKPAPRSREATRTQLEPKVAVAAPQPKLDNPPHEQVVPIGEPVRPAPEASRRRTTTLVALAVAGALLVGALAAWWRRRIIAPPLLPAQPPKATQLHSVGEPGHEPARKAL